MPNCTVITCLRIIFLMSTGFALNPWQMTLYFGLFFFSFWIIVSWFSISQSWLLSHLYLFLSDILPPRLLLWLSSRGTSCALMAHFFPLHLYLGSGEASIYQRTRELLKSHVCHHSTLSLRVCIQTYFSLLVCQRLGGRRRHKVVDYITLWFKNRS